MSSLYEKESDPECENESDLECSKESDSESNGSNSKSNGSNSDQDLTAKILSTIKQTKTPSAFAYSTIDSSLPNPVLHIPPHGTLGLPLYPEDARKIISQASQSPVGKGEETLIDTTVRKSWELNPNQFSIKNPSWNEAVEKILDTVSTSLGLDKTPGKVSAELYKLLLYEPGAFFKPHKDSEKAPGMFATLVVCLPSPHEGGKVVLTHENERHEFETASASSFGFSYAAWYSDITHEVLPIRSGYRLVLTYNLIRQTDCEVTSHNLVRGRVKELLTLLEQYNLRLEEGDVKLPPMLLHKLEHKYSSVNLKFNTLKPPDLAQVEMLRQVSIKFKFNIYLATLVLVVNTDEEYCKYSEYEEKSQSLKNVVELDGKLLAKSFNFPVGMHCVRQDRRKAYKEEHEGYTGNEGAPATYWYRDTVVVLVPPAKRLDFIFEFKNTVIEPLFFKLWQELSSDPAQKPKLEQLCERVLKQKVTRYFNASAEAIPSSFQQAAVTVLDLGRIDLFDEACKSSDDKIVLSNAVILGQWAASCGVASMTDRLMKGVLAASSIAQKVEFLEGVSEDFDATVQEPSSAEREIFQQWSNEAILTAIAQLTTLTEGDAKSLAELCKTMDWSLFESKTKPVVLKAIAMTKITFVDKLMSTLQQELTEEQQSFIEMIIRSIWNEFAFDAECHKSDLETSSSYYRLHSFLKLNDLLLIVEKTVAIFSSECVETLIIPAMLTEISAASKECTKELFIPLIRMILKNELTGFKLSSNDAVPPCLLKCLVQALLTKFVSENVYVEPQAPTNWTLPAGPCTCKDCAAVNRFLRDPERQSLDLSCSLTRSRHYQSKFKVPVTTSFRSRYTDNSQSFYDIQTIGERTPVIWRITKHRRIFEKAKSEWLNIVGSVTQTLSELEKAESVKGRLVTYLQPYYSVIMNAEIKELPELKSLVAMPQSLEVNENSALAQNLLTEDTSLKRGVSHNDLLEDGLAKRSKS